MSEPSSDLPLPTDPPDLPSDCTISESVSALSPQSDLGISTTNPDFMAQVQLSGRSPAVGKVVGDGILTPIALSKEQETGPIAAAATQFELSKAISEEFPESTVVDVDQESPPVIGDTQLLWAARFKSNLRNLNKASQPIFTEDGTRKVRAPASVILKSTDTWKDHIVAHFHGNPPPPGIIFVDLNPIWGKDGRINIKCLPNGIVLIFIPSEATRKWVLEVGCWQAGNCQFTVTAWSPTATITPIKLVSIPIWAILKDVPPQLYSLPGLSTIASGIGEPLHTEKYQLPPLAVDTLIKVEILLKKNLPKSVLVEDDDGNEVRVWVEYPRFPPKYDYCYEFGHLYHRCPTAPDISNPPAQGDKGLKAQLVAPTSVSLETVSSLDPKQVSLEATSGSVAMCNPVAGSPESTPLAKNIQQCFPVNSTHKYFDSPANDSPSEWQVVTRRTKLTKLQESTKGMKEKGQSSSPPLFAEEEEAIQIGQGIMRQRSQNNLSPSLPPPPKGKNLTKAKKNVVSTSVAGKGLDRVSVLDVGSTLPKKDPSKSLKNSTSRRSPGKGRLHLRA